MQNNGFNWIPLQEIEGKRGNQIMMATMEQLKKMVRKDKRKNDSLYTIKLYNKIVKLR